MIVSACEDRLKVYQDLLPPEVQHRPDREIAAFPDPWLGEEQRSCPAPMEFTVSCHLNLHLLMSLLYAACICINTCANRCQEAESKHPSPISLAGPWSQGHAKHMRCEVLKTYSKNCCGNITCKRTSQHKTCSWSQNLCD